MKRGLRKIKKIILFSTFALVGFIMVVLVVAFTFFRVDPDNTELDSAPSEIIVPNYFSPTWFKGQGYPVRYESLKEGWSNIPDGGKIYILPYTLTKLLYKNLEESREWVDFVNSKYKPNPSWTYNPNRRKGNYRCMAQAASTVSDWHALLLGNELEKYKSIYTGETETGLNPKILDSLYYARETDDPDMYKLNRRDLMEDPISHTPVPYSPWGYTQILSMAVEKDSLQENREIKDYNLPITYEYTPRDFHIYSKPITIFRNKAFWEIILKKEPELTKKMVEAIHKHGILYGGIKARFSMLNGNLRKTRLGFIPLAFFSGHGISIVGYIQKDDHTFFVYRETFGLGNEETPEYGVSYRIFPIYGFNEVYAFAQPVYTQKEKIGDSNYLLRVTNAEGRPITLESDKELTASRPDAEITETTSGYQIKISGPTTITLEKDFFYKENGAPYQIFFE